MKINFGEILQFVIERNNLTQKQAARALHITPQSLNSYIKNRRIPDIATLSHILQYFQLDANYILQIKLKYPKEYVSKEEETMLHLFRRLDFHSQKYIILLLKTILKL